MPTPVCGFSQPSSSATPAGHAAVQLSSEPVCRPAETPDPGSYETLYFTALDSTFTMRHIHN